MELSDNRKTRWKITHSHLFYFKSPVQIQCFRLSQWRKKLGLWLNRKRAGFRREKKIKGPFSWKFAGCRILFKSVFKKLKPKCISKCETFDWQVMVEMKTVATEKYRYFYQEESASTIFLEFLDWKHFQEVIKTNFSPNQIMICTRLFIEELIQPKFGKKNQFE